MLYLFLNKEHSLVNLMKYASSSDLHNTKKGKQKRKDEGETKYLCCIYVHES